ncbi:MAG: hypothetical protein WBQ48_04525 [Aeromicrobium sp.]|uniref:hypothetical protein n=1 Tax=Aeromicrobium sp. TaxID=1871063 RepID=UPI003C4E820E
MAAHHDDYFLNLPGGSAGGTPGAVVGRARGAVLDRVVLPEVLLPAATGRAGGAVLDRVVLPGVLLPAAALGAFGAEEEVADGPLGVPTSAPTCPVLVVPVAGIDAGAATGAGNVPPAADRGGRSPGFRSAC